MTTSTAPEGIDVQLRLEHPPSIRMIGSTRRYIEELCVPLVGEDAASRVAMATHELFENLAKYAEGRLRRLEVAIMSRQEQYHIRITATNRAKRERLDELEQILTEVSSSANPRATHLSYMNRSVARSEGSGLGLSRIRAEGEMQIGYERSGDEIVVWAETILSSGRE
jgi:anti-sigma regulatory factor (Ser/Thr protein kinase)